MPCDVADLINSSCITCHGPSVSGGAPVSLASWADLTSMSPLYPGQTEAQRCLVRLQQAVAPMPPAPNSPPSSAAVTAFSNWVSAGTPMGSCSSDGGSTAPSCSTGSFWVDNGDGDNGMAPGLACQACHNGQNFIGQNPYGESQPDRAYFFMGTVFPDFHTMDGCYETQSSAPTTVNIYDANGALALSMSVGPTGNFYQRSLSAGIALPYTAQVVRNGQVRAMTTAQTLGDCNQCHTVQGLNGAPGRIVPP